MIRAGVVGWPAKHSLSPTIHRAWLEHLEINGEYEIYERESFLDFLEEAKQIGLRGFNITIPFKELALRAAGPEHATALAKRAGAANVLVHDEHFLALNTDGFGLLSALDEGAPDWRQKLGSVIVLGAGGAARGAAASLVSAGMQVVFLNRTVERADEVSRDTLVSYEHSLADEWADMRFAIRAANAVGGRTRVRPWREDSLADAICLINATSLGMTGQPELELSLEQLPKGVPIMDMVYQPLKTPLLAEAEGRGHPIVDGLSMLIGQARPSFKYFFGLEPPPSDMVDVRSMCLAKLAARP